ncbi:MAG: Rv2175c family DNA-binding protein [Mycobacteriales bacterium]
MSAANDVSELVDEWITLPEVGERLGLDVLKVRQLLRDGRLLAVRPDDGPLRIPSAFIVGDEIVKSLPQVITLLRDNKYADEEAVRWLFTPEETLPGTPIQALIENRGTEVKRRAQASAF